MKKNDLILTLSLGLTAIISSALNALDKATAPASYDTQFKNFKRTDKIKNIININYKAQNIVLLNDSAFKWFKKIQNAWKRNTCNTKYNKGKKNKR